MDRMSRGRKRFAASDEDEEVEGNTVSRHGSTSASKRRRSALSSAESRMNGTRAHGRTSEEKTMEDLESADESEQAGDAGQGEGEEEDEMEEMAATSGEEEEDDELEEDAASEEMEAIERLQNSEGSTAAMGVVERISLTNFMCHNRLVIDLGPRLNFVIGHNGSGKSAILTAITIALGAKASATSRGTSVKSFVKEGKDAASIEVILKNTGPDAYKPDIFGDKIIVERIIRADGSGSWKIKSKAGKPVANRREELDAICDHANIQVDNPLNVLTQDASRQFLSSSNPAEKYEFFLRGTQLSQLSAEYDVVKLNIDRITSMLKQKEQGMKDLEFKARESMARYDVLKRAAVQRAELDKMRNEVVWAHVKLKEDELLGEATRSERHKARMRKIQEEIKSCEDEMKACEVQIEKLESTATMAREEEQPLHDRLTHIRGKVKEHAAEMRALREEGETLNRQYQRLGLQLDDINQRIDKEIKDELGGRETRTTAKKLRREQIASDFKNLEKEEMQMRDRIDEIGREASNLEKEKESMEAQRDQLRNTVGSLETTIRNLRSAKSNHLSAYSPNMPKLLQSIQSEQRWQDAVVGPLGAKIKLLDPKWAPILESVIGNTLNAFCVTNHHDRALLLEHKRRAGCEEVPVLTGSKEMFDYSSGEPDQDVLTILRVLRIDDEFIKRQLINAVQIERSALVEKRADGDLLLRRRPRNVRAAFSLDLFRIQYGEAGGSTQTLQPYRGPPRLSSDVEARLREALRAQPEQDKRLQAITQDIERLQNELLLLYEERKSIRQRLPQIQRSARTAHSLMEKIDEELHDDEPANTGALREARREFESEKEAMRKKFSELAEQVSELEQRSAPLIKEKDELSALLKARQEEHALLKPRVQTAAEQRLKAHGRLRHHTNQLEAARVKVSDAEKRVDVVQDQLKRFIRDAQDFHERVPVRFSFEEYNKQIATLEAELRQARRQQGTDIEAITREVEQTHNAFTKAKEDIRAFVTARRMLKDALDARLAKWFYFRRHISLRARNLFSFFLLTRGYEGSLNFDHNKGRLTLRVKTDSGHGAQGDKDPRSLSGGEKSYSTICLLLALWEAIGCPIRCLDEFDVYMDAVNRRMSMKLIMDVAKRSIDTQYVLITPQNISNVSFGPEVRVHRLADPERNQTTLT